MRALLLLSLLGCVDARAAVEGRALVISWTDHERVLEMCDSHRRYQLGVSTSNAVVGLDEVSDWVAKDKSNVVVQLHGFESSYPSGWERAPNVEGLVSVGGIHPVARGTCR